MIYQNRESSCIDLHHVNMKIRSRGTRSHGHIRWHIGHAEDIDEKLLNIYINDKNQYFITLLYHYWKFRKITCNYESYYKIYFHKG